MSTGFSPSCVFFHLSFLEAMTVSSIQRQEAPTFACPVHTRFTVKTVYILRDISDNTRNIRVCSSAYQFEDGAALLTDCQYVKATGARRKETFYQPSSYYESVRRYKTLFLLSFTPLTHASIYSVLLFIPSDFSCLRPVAWRDQFHPPAKHGTISVTTHVSSSGCVCILFNTSD
jgi:hypothetical protein